MIKKELIMETAIELFAKQGFNATSVQQITDHCGISKGAFYLSFKSKDELIIALVDYFMMQLISDIDHVVKNTADEDLLYEFYYTSFKSYLNHSDFAKIIFKEQAQSLNEELIKKIQYYERINEKNILSLVERLYGNDIIQTKYDLTYCIKGFLQQYSVLFLFYNIPLDLVRLSQSLVEKTNILARHTTIAFISQELTEIISPFTCEEMTKEQLLDLMNNKIEEIDESIEKESLLLLKEQLIEQTYGLAIIKGLLENLHAHPHCKYLAYLLRQYYNF
ncbi:TetR/AcrR family transcriptional regulator [Peribacillus sp. NPDC097295]|uniref:TetR/AcrR family transcriptional regulator n=1 Tax=Peribacillus sp. NPDC097295 TaxID=3364402 RepID=UPI00380BA44E